jgi:hypothetical protein
MKKLKKLNPTERIALALERISLALEVLTTPILVPAENPVVWNTVTDTGKRKTSEIVQEMRELFPVGIYDEENVDVHFPAPKTATTRTFKPNVEEDEEYMDKSANDIEKMGLTPRAITLRERLLMELQYFRETGQHLDIDNWTLCAGSRDGDGRVPFVNWSPAFGECFVGCCSLGDQFGRLRARVAVL